MTRPDDSEKAAPGVPVFDTHCHLDRMFMERKFMEFLQIPPGAGAAFMPKNPFQWLAKRFPGMFRATFKGCIRSLATNSVFSVCFW